MFGKVKRLEAEIQRLEKRISDMDELHWLRTLRLEKTIELLMAHLKVYEHVEPAQPEKREIRKGKKPEPKYELHGGGVIDAQQAFAQQNAAYNRPGVFWAYTR